MHFFITVLIFLVILFVYIHIIDQYKTSEDLEIYEMDYQSNIHLQEICSVKQPILFEFKSCFYSFFENMNLNKILEQGSQDVNVKDTNDYYRQKTDSADSISLSMNSFYGLSKTDTKSHFITENNHEFIEDSGLYKKCAELNEYLKPPYTMNTQYDIRMGSSGAFTPMCYHTNYRQFFINISGKARVKMTPFKSRKLLHPIKDYDNYEFWSPVNVWNTDAEYASEMEKLRFVEFDIPVGYVMYVPPYWWYSIQYVNDPTTVILGVSYQSIMNISSNIPDIIRHFLQKHNTTHKIGSGSHTDRETEPEQLDSVDTIENMDENIEKQEEEEDKTEDISE